KLSNAAREVSVMRFRVFRPGRSGTLSRFALLVLLLAVMAGCSPRKGKVSGRVLYNGQPLPGGVVTFRPPHPKPNSARAEIAEQGNYSAPTPVGDVQVSVDNRELDPRPSMPSGGLPAGLPPEVAKKLASVGAAKAEPKSAESGPPRPSGRYKKIPEKY